MPTVKLNKEVFNGLVGRDLSDDELRERIPMIGTDLEEVGKTEIEVEVFPNRPDMLSEQGFARAFSAFIGEKTGIRDYKVIESGQEMIVDSSLPTQWPYAFACIVKGIRFDDEKIREVIQIQEKLGVTLLRNRKKGGIGLYPLEKISFPVRFIGRDPREIKFRPLEYPSEITGLQILSKHPTGRTYGHICEGWDKFPIFVDDKDVLMSMPPIINSHDVGKIDETTAEVFIECTGTDPLVAKTALTIIVTALADMGGQIYSIKCTQQDGKTTSIPDLEPRRIQLDVPFINKWLGLELNENQMIDYLKRMGYGYDAGFVLVPAYRADILHMVDLAEDVAIAYGYENFEPEIPQVSTIGEESPIEIFKKRVSDVLIGLGLLETCSYNLTNNDDQNVKMGTELPLVELDSCVNTEYNVLRTWMMPSLMSILKLNKVHEYPQNIFEIGNCFKFDGSSETGVSEFLRLACVLCGPDVNFTKIKQIFQCLMDALAVECRFEATEHPSFIPGRVARVYINEKGIAYIGELSPFVLQNWDINMPVSCFELNMTDLYGVLKKG